MSSVTIVFRKDKLNRKNEAPIHFRIIKDRKISYISTGYSVLESDWDDTNKKIKSTAKGSDHKETTAKMNAIISKRYSDIQKEVIDLETLRKHVSSKHIKDVVFGKKPKDFFAFANSIVEEYESQGKISTYDKNRSTIKKLKDYVKESPITFQDITPEFLMKYESYLRKEFANKTNTIHKDLKFIRKVFNDAIRLDVIEITDSPFIRYKLKQEKTLREYLTELELIEFMKVKVVKNSKLELHKNTFIFSAYCGGIRISDVLSLKWKNFDGEYIRFIIKKTNEQFTIKAPQIAIDIINSYKSKDRKSDDFIFPIYPDTLNIEDPRDLDNELSRATASINKNLKIIGGLAKIKKPISTHIARHTWATRALRKGISIDKVSKLMGHSAIKETQVYAKIVNSELDKAMDAFND